MSRFILRFHGEGGITARDLRRIRALPGTEIIDESPRMVLVDSRDPVLKKLLSSMPNWEMTPENTIDLPDLRPKVRQSH
jgi:hypothetical protein